MTISRVDQMSPTAGSNTDVGGINVDEGMAPSDVNNAIRELMSQIHEYILGQSFIAGLVPSNDTDTDHDISISVGRAADSTNVQMMRLASAMVKQIDAAWAAGTNQGGFPSGLPSGAVQASTWYYLFLIAKTDGTCDAGFDTSATAANLLSDATGYTLYRRIASVLTDGSANIVQFKATEDAGGGLTFQWRANVEDVNVSNLGNSEVQYTLTVPTGYQVFPRFRASARGSAPVAVSLYSPDETTDPVPGTVSNRSISTEAASSVSSGHFDNILSDTSAQINAIASTASTNLDIATYGWRDPRR